MKLTICSENQNFPIRFQGELRITFDHGESSEKFIFTTPEMFREALVRYSNEVARLKEMTKMVEDSIKEKATPYQRCPNCNGNGFIWQNSTTAAKTCDVCNGRKIILMYKP